VTTDHISPAGSIKAKSPAGQYLLAQGVAQEDFNSYGSRRGNDRIMTRGTFGNVRIKNLMVPGTEGGVTRFQPGDEVMPIFEAATRYAEQGVPLVVLAGHEYGTGSSRDWAAKGTKLLGVRAVSPPVTNGSIAPTSWAWACSRFSSTRVPPPKRCVWKGDEVFDCPGPGRQLAAATGSQLADHAKLRRDRRSPGPLPDRYSGGDRVLPAWRHPALCAAAAPGRVTGSLDTQLIAFA
jgi:hypothetical protein